MAWIRLITLAAIGVLACGHASVAKAALSADELVLIVNANEPVGAGLAEYYAKHRGVPEGRIIQLELPQDETISRAVYETQVVPIVRQFLKENGLTEKVKCAVTFYGVPLKIGRAELTQAERDERERVQAEANEVQARLAELTDRAEALAREIDPNWQPPATDPQDLQGQLRRLDVMSKAIEQGGARLTDETRRRELAAAAGELRQAVNQPLVAGDPATQPANEADGAIPADPRHQASLLEEAVRKPGDAAAREMARRIARHRLPAPQYGLVLMQQLRTLDDTDTEASFDNELALLWADGVAPARWLPNPLRDPNRQPGGPDGLLMVARLDGPTIRGVRLLMDDSFAVEENGLEGKIVIDSRGMAANEAGYGPFDQQLRELAAYLEKNASLPVVHDDLPEVLPPGSQEDVVVYVGWYSVKKYVPAFQFTRGAVGYHIASFEMTTLRGMVGWVPHLLRDGIAATLGSTHEPYLQAFPPPAAFVPLLLTGKLTLAEVYWRTLPTTSWRMGLIGDPLYRPFDKKPALKPEALPPALRAYVEEPAQAPEAAE